MKKGQVAIFVLVSLFFVAAIVLFVWLKSVEQPIVEEKECSIDADCVPNECCDADLCAPLDEAPECSGVICAPGCGSFDEKFLGCKNSGEAGSCKCINQKCAPIWP